MRLLLPSGEAFEVDHELSLGRLTTNDIVISGDTFVSSHHATVRPVPGGVEVADSGSRNGTLVNGARITGPVIARPGDTIRVGDTIFEVNDASVSAMTLFPHEGATMIELTSQPGPAAVAPAWEPPAPGPMPATPASPAAIEPPAAFESPPIVPPAAEPLAAEPERAARPNPFARRPREATPGPAPAHESLPPAGASPMPPPFEPPAPAFDTPPSQAGDMPPTVFSAPPPMPPAATPAARPSRPSPFAPRGRDPKPSPPPVSPAPASQSSSSSSFEPSAQPAMPNLRARLLVRVGPDQGRSIELEPGRDYLVGRDSGADLALNDPRVSLRHARVRVEGSELRVEDLGSANGTLVDGRKVSTGRAREGAEIQVGETILVSTRQAASAFAGAPQPTIVGGVAYPSDADGIAASMTGARGSRRLMIAAGAVAAVAAVVGGVTAAVVLGGGDDKGTEKTEAEIVADWSPATVRIDVVADGEVLGGGSGSVVDAKSGLVLTNNHVASVGPLQVQNKVILQSADAVIIAAAPCDDLALIRIDPGALVGLKEVKFGSASDLKQGQRVVVMGYPGAAERLENRALSVTSGVVSKVKTVFDSPGGGVPLLPNVIQTDAAINPGNSGGPMFDLHGNQVGVNTAGLAGAGRIENENYAVSIDRVKEVLPTLKDGKSPKWIGATFDELINTNTGAPAALGIRDVTPNGPADEAGIPSAGNVDVPNLLLDKIDGKSVKTLHDYCEVMPEGGDVTLTIIDQAAKKSTNVTVHLRD